MHSAEPSDRRSEIDSSHPASADAAWRAEVASRVSSYRARRNNISGEQESFALDFGPAADTKSSDQPAPSPASAPPAISRSASAEARTSVARSVEARNLDARSAPGKQPPNAALNAFDTRYYRRLNAQSLSDTATAAAMPSRQYPEDALEAESHAATPASPDPASADPASADDEPRGHEAASLPVDLELRPASIGDAGLDRYLISGAEPGVAPAPPCMPSSEPEGVPTSAPYASSSQSPAQSPSEEARVAASAPPPGKLIAFPRPLLEPPLLPQPSRDELAEPVHGRPRILEVPEDIMPAQQGSLFPEIRLDADEPESCARREPEIEVSLEIAPVSARLMASLTDVAVVAAAGALFAAIALRALPEVPHNKTFWMMLAAVNVPLWGVYQFLFLLYAGRTVGMSLRGIHLRTFDGRVPEWRERRRRAFFICISFASVALGFLWSLVDEDTLCWHDRVSQTFPTLD